MADRERLRRLAREILKRQETTRSLDTANRRQRFMLPPSPDLPGFEFATSFTPAAEVSGDFYNFVHLSPDTLGILVGDVTGHGIEAAVVMGMAMTALSVFARCSAGPAEALSMANDDLRPYLNSETSVSAGYAVLDARRHTLTLARGGHPAPVICNPGRQPATTLIRPRGVALGIVAGATFKENTEEATVDLEEGDLVLFYTDGLTEAPSPSGEKFGIDRVERALTRRPNGSAGEVLRAIQDDLARFTSGREPEDDVTMVAVRRC